MRTLLVNPPVFDHGKYRRILEEKPIETYTMPIGIGYIASVLEKAGYEVKAVDAYQMSWGNLGKILKDYAPDIVGISCLTDQRASIYRVIRMVKSLNKEIRIVLGGTHATLMHEQMLNHFPVDAVVLGEGENPFLHLVRTWEAGEDIEGVKGIAFRRDGNVVKTKNQELIKDLDTIPFPAYHFFDLDMYAGWELHTKVASVLGYQHYASYKSAAIITSRGCPWNCSFCSVSAMSGQKWRDRTAINVVDEIEMLVNKYNCKIIDFVDDIFSVDQKRVIAISEEIIRRKLDILWGFETGVRYVSEEMLRKAAEAGCKFIMYGVESASKEVMKNVSKKTDVEKIIKAFELTKKAGIATGAFIMVGNPGENDRSINETMKILRVIKPDVIVNQILMIFPGTEQYAKAKREGFIDDRYWLSDLPAPYYEQHHSLQKLVRLHRKIFYYTMNRFSVFARTVRDKIEIHYGIKFTKRGIKMVPKIPPKSLWRTHPVDKIQEIRIEPQNEER